MYVNEELHIVNVKYTKLPTPRNTWYYMYILKIHTYRDLELAFQCSRSLAQVKVIEVKSVLFHYFK